MAGRSPAAFQRFSRIIPSVDVCQVHAQAPLCSEHRDARMLQTHRFIECKAPSRRCAPDRDYHILATSGCIAASAACTAGTSCAYPRPQSTLIASTISTNPAAHGILSTSMVCKGLCLHIASLAQLHRTRRTGLRAATLRSLHLGHLIVDFDRLVRTTRNKTRASLVER